MQILSKVRPLPAVFRILGFAGIIALSASGDNVLLAQASVQQSGPDLSQYVPSGPPIRIGVQGASQQPLFYLRDWFCGATYRWEQNLAPFAEDADVVIGALVNPVNLQEESAPMAQVIWLGKPRGGVTFTIPPCQPGQETIKLSIIGKLPPGLRGAFGGGALVAVGPAVFVGKAVGRPQAAGESSQWSCTTSCDRARVTFNGDRIRIEGQYTGCNGNPPGPVYTHESTWHLGDGPSRAFPPGTTVCTPNSETPCDSSLALIRGELAIQGGSCRRER